MALCVTALPPTGPVRAPPGGRVSIAVLRRMRPLRARQIRARTVERVLFSVVETVRAIRAGASPGGPAFGVKYRFCHPLRVRPRRV